MNKNLLTYTTLEFSDDFSEVQFESEEDVRDWFVYNMTELHRFVLYYLHHNVRNEDFFIYSDKKKNFITRQFVDYFRSRGMTSSPVIKEIGVLIQNIMPDFMRLKNII